MPHIDGIGLLKDIGQSFPEITVIMLTGRNDAETAVTCLKYGAFDYVVKPIDNVRFVTSIRKAIEHRALNQVSERLREGLLSRELQKPDSFKHIIHNNIHCTNICRYIEAIAPTQLPILITGETGVGKELFAEAIHRASGAGGEFISVNTAGIEDTLLSDTLFGHIKGAFTGAVKDRDGLICKAQRGTLFLDEIGDLRPESQVKLLRLIQDGTYYKLGSDKVEHCAARIVTATNVDLEAAQQNRTFRKDLFYRLKSHRIDIPPLRKRRGDIRFLIEHFLTTAAEEMKKKKPTAPKELFTLLENYSFPGNVRELRGFVYDAVGRHANGILSMSSFKEKINKNGSFDGQTEIESEKPSHFIFPDPLPSVKDLEEALVAEALLRAKGNKSQAAEMLGMTRKTLRNKLDNR